MKSKQSSPFKFLPILAIAIIKAIDSYIYIDIIAIHTNLQQHFIQLNEDQFELYYNTIISLSAFINVFLCILNGCIIDKLGLRVSLIFLILCLNFGQYFAYFALTINSLPIFMLGRILISVCGLNYIILCGKFISEYYKNEGLAIWNSLLIFFLMIGQITVLNVAPRISYKHNLMRNEYFNSLLLAICDVLAIFALIWDFLIDKSIQQYKIQQDNEFTEKEDEQLQLQKQGNNKNTFCETLKSIKLFGLISELKCCPKAFWYFFFALGLQKCTYNTFFTISTKFVAEYWSKKDSYWESNQHVGTLISKVQMTSLILVFILGKLADYYNNKLAIFVFLASFIQLFVFSSFLIIPPLYSMILLGLCISIRLVTLLPVLVQVVPEEYIGRCYSIVVVFGEFGVVILSFISGILRDWFEHYDYVLILFMVLEMISVIYAWKMIKFL